MDWSAIEWGTVIATLFGATIGAFAGAYFKRIGEIRAETAEFTELKRRLVENTRATQEVLTTFSQKDYLARSELDFRKQQLTDFYGPIYGSLKVHRELYVYRSTEIRHRAGAYAASAAG
jgi:hypothetical protein